MLAGPREAEQFRRHPKGGGSRTLPKVPERGREKGGEREEGGEEGEGEGGSS